MRVMFLTQWFTGQPEGLLSGIADSLIARGAHLAVLSGDLQSHTPWFRKLNFNGRRDDARHVGVMRYPYFHSHDRSSAHRFLTYGSFAATSMRGAPYIRQADVVLAYCSPATAAAAALVTRRRGGPPVVLMIQDVWPDSIFATGFVDKGIARSVTRRTMNGYMSWAYSTASQITANSPSMRDLLVKRGANPDRTHVIYNWGQGSPIGPQPIPPRQPGQPLEVMYAGNVGPGQDLSNVVRAMASIPKHQARLTIVGDGVALPEVKALAQQLALDNVRFLDRVPKPEMPEVLAKAHLHLVPLADTDLFRLTIPSKFQSLLAAGRPVLSVAPGEVALMVRRSGCGYAAPPGDPEALVRVIREATTSTWEQLQMMGAAGFELYSELMTEERNADQLAEVLRTAAAEG